LVDQINRYPADYDLLSGATVAMIGFQSAAAQMRQNQNDSIGFHVVFPSHWQTFDVDVYWAVVAAVAGNPTFRFDTKVLAVGQSLASAFDTTGASFSAAAAAGQYVEVKSTVAANIVVDTTKELFVRLFRLALTPDGLAANIGVSRIALRRSL